MDYEFEIKGIEACLKELETMPPLPKAGTPEALAIHDEWMHQHDRIEKLVRDAEQYALLSVPRPVAEVFEKVWAHQRALFHV